MPSVSWRLAYGWGDRGNLLQFRLFPKCFHLGQMEEDDEWHNWQTHEIYREMTVTMICEYRVISREKSWVMFAIAAMDVSADLTELGRTPVTVVSAGIKSILDVGRTLEYLVSM